MGGASTEIAGPGPDGTIDVLLEGAHWEPTGIARTARRHKLPSEASKRFERVVDPQLPPAAVERAAQLLVEHGGGTIAPGRTDVGAAPTPAPVRMPLALPDRVAGVAYPPGATCAACARSAAASSWSPTHAARPTSSRPRPRGGRTCSSPPTSWRRCCGWRASTSSRRCCRPRPAAAD
jgi:phenylalanyl-tRNA synthetase beta subunit